MLVGKSTCEDGSCQRRITWGYCTKFNINKRRVLRIRGVVSESIWSRGVQCLWRPSGFYWFQSWLKTGWSGSKTVSCELSPAPREMGIHSVLSGQKPFETAIAIYTGGDLHFPYRYLIRKRLLFINDYIGYSILKIFIYLLFFPSIEREGLTQFGNLWKQRPFVAFVSITRCRDGFRTIYLKTSTSLVSELFFQFWA